MPKYLLGTHVLVRNVRRGSWEPAKVTAVAWTAAGGCPWGEWLYTVQLVRLQDGHVVTLDSLGEEWLKVTNGVAHGA